MLIEAIKSIFSKTLPEAQDIMLKVHNEGVAVCGIYAYEVAESKASKVTFCSITIALPKSL